MKKEPGEKSVESDKTKKNPSYFLRTSDFQSGQDKTARLPKQAAETLSNLQSFGELHHRLIEFFAPPSILIGEDNRILHLSDGAGQFLHFSGGEPSNNLLRAIHPALFLYVQFAILTAHQQEKPIKTKNIRINLAGEVKFINLIVRPVKLAESFTLVTFEESSDSAQTKDSGRRTVYDTSAETLIRQMESELTSTRDRLQAKIDQSQAMVEEHLISNEELQAINEELRVASEELETNREELQTVNEELQTANHELKEKIKETNRANSDLQNLMSSTEIATIFLDRELKIKRFTPRATELFNVVESDVGRPLTDLTNQLTLDDFAVNAARVLQSLQPFEREVWSKDNRYFIVRFLPYRTLEDKIDGVVMTFIDITERKKAEESLRLSEERLQGIFSQTSVGICQTDLSGRLTAANSKFLEIFGFGSKAEILGETWSELTTDKFALQNTRQFDQLVAQGTSFEIEKQMYRKDGSLIWVRISVSAIRDEKSNSTSTVAVVHDITERKRAEDELRKAEERYRFQLELDVQDRTAQLAESREQFASLVENTPDVITRWNKDLQLIYANSAFESKTGVSNETLYGKNNTEMGQPDEIAVPYMASLKKVFETGEAIEHFNSFPTPKGEAHFYSRIVPEKNENGKTQTVLGIARDITDLKNAEQEIIRVNEKLAQAAEERYRTLFEKIDEGFCVIHMVLSEEGKPIEGLFVETNPAFEHETGLQNAVGRTILELAPRRASFLIQTFGEIVLTGKSSRFEYQSESGKRWYEVYAFRIGESEERRIAVLLRDISERRRTESLIRESEERLRITVDAAQMATWDWNLETDEIVWNERHFTMLGMKPSEKPQYPEAFFNHVYPDDREHVGERLKKSIENNALFEAEFRIVRDDGKIRWMEGYGQIVKKTNGKPVRMAGVMSDITSRKRSEEILRESLEQLRVIFNQATAGFAQTDLSGKFIFANRAYCKITGYSRKELLQKSFKDITHPDDYHRNAHLLKNLIERGESFVIEKRYIRKDGSIVWVQNNISAIRDADKKIQAQLAVSIDISERMTAIEAVRRSEERLQLIMKSITDHAIITTDQNFIINGWNAGAENVFGYAAEEVFGKSCDLIFTSEDLKAGVPQKETKKALEKGYAEDNRWHLRRDGSRFYATGMLTPIKDSETGGFVKIAQDQTGRIAAEKAIQEKDLLEKLVGAQEDERRRIARDLHDELGQQLVALRLKIKALHKEYTQGAELTDHLDDLSICTKKIDEVVDFLAWELRPAALDHFGLYPAIEQYVREWSKYSGIAADFFSTNLKKTRFLPEIEINLYRILQEAMNNIHKHARATLVEINLEKRDAEIVLIIEDNGIGFTPEKKSNKVTNIGLIGMQERAKLVGGSLQIQSTPGSGTVVFVRVPEKSPSENTADER